MKLEHLIQAYNFNKIPAKTKEEVEIDKERAGTIEFYNGIVASYLLDNEEIIVAMKLFMNCLTRDTLTLTEQLSHTIKVLQVIQQTIMLLGNIPQKECNMILEKLGLFDNTFQKRKTNKTSRTYIQDRGNRWIIMSKYRGGNVMEIKQIADDILIDGKTILKNRYQKTRDRVTRFEHNYNMSDKEIIEFLDDEIRQYRNRIEEQEKTIKELQEKQTIESETMELKVAERKETEIIDEDIEEIETTNIYASGKLLATTIMYKYKDKPKDKLKAIYKAQVFEYESGRIDTMYECDKENNDECSKESCTSYNQCNHTSNIKYAKNYIDEKYNN